MPNHIKNRIEIIGTEEQVKSVFERFNTFHESVPKKSFDGNLVFKNADGGVGWLNEETNEFVRREKETAIGVPDGFNQDFEEEYNEFPDFNKIIPQPVNIFKGNLGRDEENMCRKEGRPTWLDWNRENWGSKWGGYSYTQESENTFIFETAWSSAVMVIRAMSGACPDVTINYEYADEDTGSNCGQFSFKNGEIISQNVPQNGSTEAYEIAFKLMPNDKEYYALVDGKHQYKEDE